MSTTRRVERRVMEYDPIIKRHVTYWIKAPFEAIRRGDAIRIYEDGAPRPIYDGVATDKARPDKTVPGRWSVRVANFKKKEFSELAEETSGLMDDVSSLNKRINEAERTAQKDGVPLSTSQGAGENSQGGFPAPPPKDMDLTEIDEEVTRDLLSLADFDVPLEKIKEWPAETIKQVEKYAGAIILRASDNVVKIPPIPEVLKKYEK